MPKKRSRTVPPKKPQSLARSRRERDNRLETALGQVVREFRKRAGLGTSELARLAKLSSGMVSKIENGAISPSLASIRALSRALQVPVTSLFREFDEVVDATFVRAGEGTLVHRSGPRIEHEYRVLGQTSAKGIAVEPYLMTYTEKSQVLPFLRRAGTQFIYVLEGELRYRHGTRTYVMAEGDALLFQADVPHGPEALLRTPVRYISVLSFLGGMGG
jgi:transcriptional regulator with XRE-family HTH domain/mannose-6-phosphate isomerase-like protein (cupin superfamily)